MKSKILYPLYLAIAVCIGIAIGVFFDFPNYTLSVDKTSQREQKIRKVLNYIDYEYVDKVNTDSLLDRTISDLMSQLDPHSVYIPKSEVQATEEAIRGSFVGIGVEFRIYKDTLTIVRVLPEGPSAEAGLKAGQRILKADTVAMYGKQMTNHTVVNTLKGKQGSEVQLTIQDPQKKKQFTQTVQRDEVNVSSVHSRFLLNDSTGYLKLAKFTQHSPREVENALRELRKKGAKNIVLDLRNNPGGLLTAAQSVADEFLEDEELIVFTKDRQGEKNSIYATREGVYEQGEVAVLINENSASASEIVAGALQDNDRGIIIGERSFGKGLVQEEIRLPDGSRLRMTTQRYFTPSGRSIQKDYKRYSDSFRRQGFHKGLPEDGESSAESSQESQAGQKKKYVRGGIKPDVRVEPDSSSAPRLLYNLAMSTNIDERAFEYVDKHRALLEEMGEDKFVNEFEVDDEVLAVFFASGLEKVKDREPAELELIKNHLKAFIASNIYGNRAYQRLLVKRDPYLKAARKSFTP